MDLNNSNGTDEIITKNKNYDITSEVLNEKEVKRPTRLAIVEKMSNPLLISTAKYSNMLQNTTKVAGIMNKTFLKNNTEDTNHLRVKDAINFTTHNFNAGTLSDLPDAMTASLKDL